MCSGLLALALFVASPLDAATSLLSKPAIRMQSEGDVVMRVLSTTLPSAPAAYLSDPAGEKSWGLAIWLIPGYDVSAVVARLTELGAVPVALSLRREGARILVTVPAGAGPETYEASSSWPEVAGVSAWGVPELLNDESIWVGQSNDSATRSTPIFDRGITGTGEVVSVWDSGTDPDMCYFVYTPGAHPFAQTLIPPAIGVLETDKKVWAYYVSPGAAAYDSLNGHGTAVSGCVLGDNFLTLSTPSSAGHDPGDGQAPNANLIIQDGFGPGSSGIVGDLSPMLLQSYLAGARIQNHSWGTDVNFYGADAADLDRFAWRHEDMLFVNAAGNSALAPGDATVLDPSTAKNVLTVGATVNGTALARDLTDFTSRGPTFDGRLKPDIVAPGLQQWTARGSGGVGDGGCEAFVHSGTSFASPTAAGWAALMRQYLREGYLPSGARSSDDETRPSAALVKAMMIVSAVPIEGNDPRSGAPVTLPPSLDQGWGRPLLEEAMYFAGDGRRTTVIDLWNGNGLRNGESATIDVEVSSSGEPLDVVLVWTDPPVATPLATPLLVNDLDLVVTDPSGIGYLGNVWSGGASTTGGSADRLNNVEAVRVEVPPTGLWSIRVDVAGPLGQLGVTDSDRQGFALVVTHAECGGPTPLATALVAAESPSGILVTWTAAPGASGYRVYRAEGPAPIPGDFALITPQTVPVASYTDLDVQCGVTYTYRVRSWNDCSLGGLSSPVSQLRALGSCDAAPTFAGLAEAKPTGVCGQVRLSWPAAASNCVCSTGIVYNVWSSPTLPVDVGAVPIASCVTGTSATLDVGASGGLQHYVVRAEDRVPGGAGVCGGVSDANLETLATVPTSPTRLVSLRDDFEAGRGLWQREATLGFHSWDIVVEPFATSFDEALSADDQRFASDSVARLLPAILPSADTLVSFWHTYELEGRFDGGVVELSTDFGVTWQDAGGRLVAGHYDDWLMTGPDSATLRPGFTGGALATMTEELVWLGDLVGQTVALRFRMLSDGFGERERWSIDDFEVVQRDCPATPGELVAGFTHDGPTCVGSPVCADGSQSYGGVLPHTYLWDFGDGSPQANGSTTCHAYTSPGTYVLAMNVYDSASAVDGVAMPVEVVDEVAPPDLGNTLRAVRAGLHYVLRWTEPAGQWPGTEIRAATASDLSDIGFAAVVPWGQPREYTRWYGVAEAPALRLWKVGLYSTCEGLPGP